MQKFRKAVSDPDNDGAVDLGRALYDLTLAKIAPQLGGATNLLIAPDGALNLVPFAALVDEKRQFLIKIPVLAFEFLEDLRQELGRASSPRLAPEALERLRRYWWPGNVAELRDVVRRALLLCDGAEISTANLTIEIPGPFVSPHATDASAPPAPDRRRIPKALQAAALRPTTPVREPSCAFCDEPETQVGMLFRGSSAIICGACVDDARTLVASATNRPDEQPTSEADASAWRADADCAFCRKNPSEVAHLVKGATQALICNQCLDAYDRLLRERA